MSSIYAFIVPTAETLNQSFPTVDSTVREVVQLAGAAIAGVSFIGIVTAKWVRRRRARHASVRDVGPTFVANVSTISDHDKTFDVQQFLGQARSTFQKVQTARQTGEAGSVRELMADDFWEAFSTVLDRTAASHRHVVVDHLKLHRVTIQSAINLRALDSITVRIVASCAEYEVDERGKRFGDRRIKSWREDWTFQRSTNPDTRLRGTWGLTLVEPVVSDRFDSHRRRSITEWTPTAPKA